MSMTDFLTTAEMAEALGCALRGVHHRAKSRGILPALARGRVTLWHVADLERLREPLPFGFGSPKHPKYRKRNDLEQSKKSEKKE